MNSLIGQKILIDTLDSYELESMPHALLFVGESGCGKHTFSSYLAARLGLETVTVPMNCSDEDLVAFSQCSTPKLYILDLNEALEKAQNKFLKFIEEPTQTVYISLIANSEFQVLNTIKSRCTILRFSQYTYQEIKQVVSDFNPKFSELDYKICRTPGAALALDSVQVPKLRAFCESIVLLKAPVRIGQLLTNYTKINCFENYDQYNFDAFFNMLAYVALNRFYSTSDSSTGKLLNLITDYMKRYYLAPSINKHDFLLSFFSNLYLEVF